MNKKEEQLRSSKFRKGDLLPKGYTFGAGKPRFSYDMNKRGQVFLIAALLIVIIAISLTAMGTFASASPEPNTIKTLKQDLERETHEIIDYGIYQEKDIELLIDEFTTDKFAPYFLDKTDNTNIVFVYGDKTNLKAVKYNTASTGTISAQIGGNINWQNFGTFTEKIQITPSPSNTLTVTLLNQDYIFKLRENEMFYFIVVQERVGETYIERN